MVHEHLLCVQDSQDVRVVLMEVMPWMLSQSGLNGEMTDQHTIAFIGNGAQLLVYGACWSIWECSVL